MKRLSRLTALLLAIMVLCATVAYAEGVLINDWTMSDLEEAVEAASGENGGEVDITSCEACPEYCEMVRYMLEECHSAQERYEYLMTLYVEEPEGEVTAEDLTLEYVMMHYYFCHVEDPEDFSTYDVCVCQFPLAEPELYAPGDLSAHTEADCPWKFENLCFGDQYDVVVMAEDAAAYTALMTAEDREKLDRVNLTDYTAQADGANVAISVPEGAFEDDYILSAEGTALAEGEQTALDAQDGVSVVSSFAISFADLRNEDKLLQPAEDAAVNLTFTVDAPVFKGGYLQVYHMIENEDGTYTAEAVGEPIYVDQDADVQTVTVEANAFSTYTVVEGIPDVGDCTVVDCTAYTACTNSLERYAYIMGELYDEGNTAETMLLHLARYHANVGNELCECYFSPMYAPGSFMHDEGCVWEEGYTADEYLAAYRKLKVSGKAYFLSGMDTDQLSALQGAMTDEEQEEMAHLIQEDIPDYLITDAIKAWVLNADNAVTAQMVTRAYEVDAQLTAEGSANSALSMMRLEKTEEGTVLISVYTGEVIADYDETTGALIDRSMGLTVGYVQEDGTIAAPPSDETTGGDNTGDDTTN